MQNLKATLFFYRFLQGIRFHTQREDAANTTSIWSFQRNCHHYNDTLQKAQKQNGSFR